MMSGATIAATAGITNPSALLCRSVSGCFTGAAGVVTGGAASAFFAPNRHE
jgi:organic hydroperoxide reductase OsmC/OhrA